MTRKRSDDCTHHATRTHLHERSALPPISAFTHETLKQWPLDAAVAEKLGQCVVAAARHAIDHAYPAGEEGSIELTVREAGGKLEFIVRDYGLPQDVAMLEKRLHGPSVPAANKIALNWPVADAFTAELVGYVLTEQARVQAAL